MNSNDCSLLGPSRPKRDKIQAKNPNKLTEKEMEYFLYNSCSEDEVEDGEEWEPECARTDSDSEDAIDEVDSVLVRVGQKHKHCDSEGVTVVDLTFVRTDDGENSNVAKGWQDAPMGIKTFQFTAKNEFVANAPATGEPCDCFRLVVDDDFLNLSWMKSIVTLSSYFVIKAYEKGLE